MNKIFLLLFISVYAFGWGDPKINIKEDVSASEDKNITFTVTLSDDDDEDTTFKISTSDDTAKEPDDYTKLDNEQYTIPAGDTNKTFTVEIKDDNLYEDDENFTVKIVDHSDNVDDGDNLERTGTIENNDNLIYVEGKTVDEGAGTITVTIKAKDAVDEDTDVHWQLDDGSADTDDYTDDNGTVTFSAGDDEKNITIDITDDSEAEDDENFTVNLTNDNANEIEYRDGNITIIDNECPGSDTLDIAIYDNYWDAEQQGDDVDHSSSDLEMMYDEDNEQKIGIVFKDVNVKHGCYIKNAYIQFTAKGDKKNDTSIVIYGEDTDNAISYKDDRKVTDAVKTDKNVTWKNIHDWEDNESDSDTRTPQISCLVKKIIDRDNWKENNDMGFIIYPTADCNSSDCNRRAYSGGDDDRKAVLHIEYSDNPDDDTPCQIAQDDNYDVRMGETVTLKVTQNDADGVDDDSVDVKTEPSHGTYEVDGNTIKYTPDDGYKGDDNLTYTVKLNGDESNEAFVALHVDLKGGDVDFHIINPPDTRNIQGNYVLGGNMSLCVADDEDSECKSQAGTNDTYVKYIDIDDDDSTYNSSAFTLDVPDGSKVIWAGLFWGGFIHNTKNDDSDSDDDWQFEDKIDNAKEYDNGPGLDLKDNAYDTDKVKLKVPTSDDYQDVNASTVYFSKYGFSSYANITYLFKDGSGLDENASGEYILANLSTNHKKVKDHGNSGGWSMLVIYENPDAQYKNVSVFHGWVTINDNSADFNVTGFLIPDTDNVKAKMSFMAHDGDNNDQKKSHFKLNDTSLGLWTDDQGNDHDDRDYVFNSTILNVPDKRWDFDTDDSQYSSFGLDTYDASGILDAGDTSANIKLDGDDGAYEVELIVFSADMFAPKLCYDYTYKQGDRYFTEDNNGTQKPRIVGDIDKNKNIDVELYIRNAESDINATDVTVDVDDINTTQAKYDRDSTWVTQPNENSRTDIDDDDLNVSDSYDKNISINDVGSKEHFYIGYSLDPEDVNDVNMSLNVSVKYNIQIGDNEVQLPRMRLGSEKVPICSDGTQYVPSLGTFNVVHQDYYKNDDTYLNIPTQVVDRDGRFRVLSLDENGTDLKKRTTIVAVEYIDAGVFHDTQASCDELNNTISDKEWIIFDDEDEKDFIKQVGEARKNTAYRISFHNDVNGTLISLKKSNGNYVINNYDDVFDGIDKCDACGDDGDALSEDDLKACMNCIYGQRTGTVCSRDNFAVRPEAFYIRLNDQNQTDNTQKTEIINNVDGTNVEISAGYNYFVELNATKHTDEKLASNGYTLNDDNIKLIWNSTKTGCNDDSNKTVGVVFMDGVSDRNLSNANVGEYELKIVDDSWTDADKKPIKHHDGNFTDGDDCILNDDVVATEDDSADNEPLNGCVISSSHTNKKLDKTYHNLNVTFDPYSFSLDINPTVGLEHSALGSNSYIYMADMQQNSGKDENMSLHLDGNITASGYDGGSLTNFVNDCYASDIIISLDTTDRNISDVNYTYSFSNDDNSSLDKNGTLNDGETITLSQDNFTKDRNGTLSSKLNLNYTRKVNTAINPKEITFHKYILNTNVTMNADLQSDYKAKASKDINKSVKHYYGRTNAPRATFSEDSGQKALIYYEVYCEGTGCDKSLLQDGVASKYLTDPRWFINTQHTSKFGTAGDVNQRGYVVGDGYVKQDTAPTGNHQDSVTITYDGTKGHPYKTTMENNASKWLIYSKYDENAEKNKFQVEFYKTGSGWAGTHGTNTNTKVKGAKINKRTMMW